MSHPSAHTFPFSAPLSRPTPTENMPKEGLDAEELFSVTIVSQYMVEQAKQWSRPFSFGPQPPTSLALDCIAPQRLERLLVADFVRYYGVLEEQEALVLMNQSELLKVLIYSLSLWYYPSNSYLEKGNIIHKSYDYYKKACFYSQQHLEPSALNVLCCAFAAIAALRNSC